MFWNMSVKDTVSEILKGSPEARIIQVVDVLERGGVSSRDDLKYFSWTSLKEFGSLSEMEINKIMRYVQTNFPEEYKEHKLKKDEEARLEREVELSNLKIESEKTLQREKNKHQELMHKKFIKIDIHPNADEYKTKSRRAELSFGGDRLKCPLQIFIFIFIIIFAFIVNSPLYLVLGGGVLFVAAYHFDQNGQVVQWKPCIVVYFGSLLIFHVIPYVAGSTNA